MFRSSAFLIVLALLVSSCGYTRSEAVTLRGGSTSQSAEAVEPAVSEVPLAEEEGPLPTALPPALEIASKGASAEVAASVEYADGTNVSFTFGELEAIVQPSLADAEYRALGDVAETFDVQILNLLLFNDSLAQELVAVEVEVSEADQQAADDALLSEVSGLLASQAGDPTLDRTEAASRLFAEVPHLQLILDTRTKQEALIRHYGATAEPGQVPCVSHIQVDDEQTALGLLADIEGGSVFAEVAAENSVDTSTSDAGGMLGCVAPEEFQDPGFVAGVQSAQVGEVAGPVQSALGWHLILVSQFVDEEIAPEALAERVFNVAIAERFETATITVAPVIGTWDSEQNTLVPAGS